MFLNHLLGLQRLGHDVTFIDRLEPAMLTRPDPGPIESTIEAEWLHQVMCLAGLGEDYVLITDDRDSRRTAAKSLDGVDLLINVNGFLDDDELRESAETVAFWDIDPGIQQIWEQLGLASLFDGHDLWFTVGANIGAGDCLIPTCGIEWIPTRQPVVMDRWQVRAGGSAFTTLATWRGPYAPVEYEGRTYGMRVHEFRRFSGLPRRASGEFLLALDIDPADDPDLAALHEGGWEVVSPRPVSSTPALYQQFIQSALAEIAIAKEVYVATRSGWFSDRSACYLASGKPVIAVDTGLADSLPTGEGLLCVTDVDSAALACEEVLADLPRHQRAAREIALEYFDSDKVLREVLDFAGI